jgi:hypothetical protein
LYVCVCVFTDICIYIYIKLCVSMCVCLKCVYTHIFEYFTYICKYIFDCVTTLSIITLNTASLITMTFSIYMWVHFYLHLYVSPCLYILSTVRYVSLWVCNTHTHTHIHTQIHTQFSLSLSLSIYIYIYIYICVCVCVCVCGYVFHKTTKTFLSCCKLGKTRIYKNLCVISPVYLYAFIERLKDRVAEVKWLTWVFETSNIMDKYGALTRSLMTLSITALSIEILITQHNDSSIMQTVK